MKKIIAFCKDIAAPEHPEYEWFEDESGLNFNDGEPIVFRFGDYVRDEHNLKTPWFDCDNDLILYLYRNEKDADNENYRDYEYICGSSSITFLFDDGTTKQFKVDRSDSIWDEWDGDKKEPTGVYKELVAFLEGYIENGGYETASKYMLVPEVEFMDI